MSTPVIDLDAGEARSVAALTRELAERHAAVDGSFLADALTAAQELPRRLREQLNAFRLHDTAPAYRIVRGYVVAESALEPTPRHWQDDDRGSASREHEMALALIASVLGDPFGWSTQQGGRIVNDVIPIAAHEHDDVDTGSAQPTMWHVENAFHDDRCDYFGLMCLRNPTRAATTVATLDAGSLDADTLAVLRQPRYVIEPDLAHLKEQAGRTLDTIAIFFGDAAAPYVRFDPVTTRAQPNDPAAAAALRALVAAIDASLGEVILEPGQILFVDNYRALHGRRPFRARYDGADRWLKRVDVTRDLRKSRAIRAAATSRVLTTAREAVGAER
ncbi:MAG: guanitoxin biosynthesis L-enduracididine beta-hydroxylase GntD [Vulcanimicrobiaceae bacterium]|jgi:hypothetical protein